MCLGETGCQEKGTITLENKRLLPFLVKTCLYNHSGNKSSECDILNAVSGKYKGLMEHAEGGAQPACRNEEAGDNGGSWPVPCCMK